MTVETALVSVGRPRPVEVGSVCAVTVGLILFGGCGVRHGAPEGSPGHVSEAATIPTRHKLPDGSLNACLTCDEVNSGPTFKAVAGRTRRRSGLSSAIARPCLDALGEPAVYPVEHYYFAKLRR